MTNPTPLAGAARNLRELSIRPYSVDQHRCVVVLAGEVDLASSPDLKAALTQLLDLGYTDFVLDLSQVSHMDSTGLSVLVGLQKRLDEAGRLVLAAVPPNVARLLSFVGLDTQLETSPSLEAVFETSSRADPGAPVSLEPRVPAAHPTKVETEPIDPSVNDANVPIDADAGLVLGLASTALPFAESTVAEAERWLRILRRYGDAGRILREAGVREAPFADFAADEAGSVSRVTASTTEDRLAAVGERAKQSAADRHADAVGTVDILMAVASIYGSDCDRVLAAYGGDHAAVHERLESVFPLQ